MTGSTFTTVKDEYVSADWPDSTHAIVTSVQGDLADKIRARSGLQGEVRIFENGQEGGYSEYTVEWDWEFIVKVGEQVAFSTDWNYDRSDFTDLDGGYNGIADLMRWLGEQS